MGRWCVIALLIFFWAKPVMAQVVINEFLPQPENDADEWIELYNQSSEEISLDGWYLDDSEGGTSPYSLTPRRLAPYSFLVIGKQDSGVGLNNGGDSVRLLNREQDAVDVYIYTSTKVNSSYGRTPDGVGEWHSLDNPSPGSFNSPPTLTPTPLPTATPAALPSLTLSEIMACPPPGESEWIEYLNNGGSGSVDGWTIEDKNGNKKMLTGTILQNGRGVLDISPAFLNNDGDEIHLKNPDEAIAMSMYYDSCTPTTSFIYVANTWQETTTPTKRAANIVTGFSPTPLKPSATPKPPTETPLAPTSPSLPLFTPTLKPPLLSRRLTFDDTSATLPALLDFPVEETTHSGSVAGLSTNIKVSPSPYMWFMGAGLFFILAGLLPIFKRFVVVFHS